MPDEVTFHIEAPLPRDRRGLVALRCPKEECRKLFQVLPGTGLKTSTHSCPYCGETGDADTFRRDEDLAAAREVAIESGKEHALAYAHDLIQQTLGNAFRGNRNVSYRPGSPAPRPRPPRQIVYPDLDLETEVTCDGCGLVFRIYGVFARCPDCANINAFVVLDADMAVCEKRLARSAKVRAEGEEAEATELLWDALSSVVARFDALGKELREHHPTRFPEKPKNLFQNLNALDKALQDRLGTSLQVLAGEHHKALVLGFQARHLHEHNHDVVDEDFLRNTGADRRLKARKYPLTESEVAACISAVRHLVGSLRGLLEPPTEPPA